MVNKVTLIGNLGRDPEIRTLENGTKVGTFSLATNENYKDKNDTWQTQTEWHNIVVWRGLAEKAERELKKGSLAYIEGKITHRKYQDREGVERSVSEVVASNLNSLDKREKTNAPFPGIDNDFSSGGGSINNPSTPETGDNNLPF